MLRRALIAVVAATLLPMAASAQTPIVFVHGNGDHAGLWDNVIWRFESNGYPSSRLFAVDLPNPSASSTLTAVELNRSTPEEQTAALAAFVTRVLLTTGAPKVALVGSSRGGMTIRNYVRYGGGAAHVSHVITSGTPNHGVFAIPTVQPNGEFNGAGPYLRALNRGSEVVPGVKFLALRSDSLDKFAQADGAGLGMKGTPTNVDANGPALRGAMNVVLPGTDHREVAFGPAAFRAQYRFITGRTPTQMDIVADTVAVLEGMISGHANASPTNLPLANAVITVHAVDAATGQRLGRVDVGAGHGTVAVDVGVDDGGDAGVLELAGEVESGKIGGLGPALDRHHPLAGVDADGNLPGEGPRRFAHDPRKRRCRVCRR